MTRGEAKELLPIIQAFADGKTIQISYKNEWITLSEFNFDKNPKIYRIKPEPKYRPFKNKEECWNEMLKHQPFGWLKNKNSGDFALIGSVYKSKEVWFVWSTNGGNSYSAHDLFNDYVFTDGTPFGITR